MRSPRSHRLASSAAGSFPAAEEVERLKLSAGIQAAEQTVRLAVRAGGEIKRVGRPSTVVVAAERDGPQPVDENRLPLGVAHLAKKLAGVRIEGVDMTVAKISDPQGAAQFTKTCRR